MGTHESDNTSESLTTPFNADSVVQPESTGTPDDDVMSRVDMRIGTDGVKCTFETTQARVADLTGNGMRLTLSPSKLPQIGETHSFTFSDNQTEHQLTVEGIVRWIRKGSVLTRKAEVGIEFVDLPATYRDALTRLAVQGELLISNNAEAEDADSSEADCQELPINLYDILSVCQYASQDEIRASFHVLVKQWHPDHNEDPQAPARFEELHKAYSILRDPALRARYDERFGPDQAAA
jgi:DnaJ-like protein/PilZ domain-containing protein